MQCNFCGMMTGIHMPSCPMNTKGSRAHAVMTTQTERNIRLTQSLREEHQSRRDRERQLEKKYSCDPNETIL